MRRNSHVQLDDAGELDLLSQYWDGRVQGRPTRSNGLDPNLERAVEHLHGVAARQATDPRLQQRIWDNLMGSQTAQITLLHPVSLADPSPPLASHRLPDARVTHCWPFGRVAAAAAIVLFAAATLFVAALAIREKDAAEPPVTLVAPSSYATGVRPAVAPCSVAPRSIDDMRRLLTAPFQGASVVIPTSVVSASSQTSGSAVLPDGPTPDNASIAAVIATYAEYWGCVRADDPLRVAALYSASGVQRTYYPNGVPDIVRIMHADQPPDPRHSRSTFDVGDPAPGMLSDFRRIGGNRIAAYVSSSPNGTEYGYVVFVQDGDRWLIDDISAFRG